MSATVTEQITAAAAELSDLLGPLVRGEVQLPFSAALARVSSAQDACLDQLARTGLWGLDNRLPASEFWKLAGGIIGHGPLQRQAREKPRGYAGDFEMLDQIADDRISPEVLPGAFDRYFQNQAAPKAVRNRTAEIAQRVVDTVREHTDRTTRIASVGSGSAADVRRAVRELDQDEMARLQISLFDLDPNALTFATSKLGRLSPGQLKTHRVNLFRLPRQQRLASLLANSDLVFCSGLFDYLSHADAVAMLQAFWTQLRPGGRLLVFNYSPRNPSRAYMEWFGNWYLQYRTPVEMQKLAYDAGWHDDEFDVKVEQENVNLYIEAQKHT